ncbi:MAG: leucine-rich repeat domain-containing protein [Treponema sp.]|jgi:hypothetical protein|nr:leucine-rich repeat domain-containing protein [Treponema sp.]
MKTLKKNVSVFLIMVVAGLQLSCGGGSTSISKLEQAVKESIQNTMNSESPFKDQDIKIDSVKLEKSSDYTFNGTINLTVDKIKNKIFFNVISDGQNVVWYIDPSAFTFVDSGRSRKVLENTPEDIVRVGFRTESPLMEVNISSEPNERTDFLYDLNLGKDGIVISEYVGKRSNVVIPVLIDGFPVMEIAEWAFRGNEHITSVVLPPIRVIFNDSFHDCKNLANVTLPDTLVFIGDNVFENCQSLVSITIPNSVTYIGRGAFFNCLSLSSVALPNYIESIERSTFMNCSLLTSIKMPESVKYIIFQAFKNCSNLIEVELPSHQIAYIGGNSNIDEDRYRVIFDKDKSIAIRQARPISSARAGIGTWDGAFEEISFLDLNRTTQITGWDERNFWRPMTFQRYKILFDPNNFAFDGCIKFDLPMRLKIEQSGYKGTFN